MGWEKRGNRRYYYKSKRVRGKVRKLYLGAGPAAEYVASEEARQRKRRQYLCELRSSYEQTYTRYEDTFALILSVLLAINGYHYHRGEWRRRRATRTSPMDKPTTGADNQPTPEKTAAESGPKTYGLEDFERLAESSRPEDQQLLRELLEQRPDIYEQLGNLRASAEIALARMATNDYKVAKACVRLHAEKLRKSLLDDDSTALEKLCVERAVLAFQAEHAIASRTYYDQEVLSDSAWQKALGAAEKRFHGALKAVQLAQTIARDKRHRPLRIFGDGGKHVG